MTGLSDLHSLSESVWESRTRHYLLENVAYYKLLVAVPYDFRTLMLHHLSTAFVDSRGLARCEQYLDVLSALNSPSPTNNLSRWPELRDSLDLEREYSQDWTNTIKRLHLLRLDSPERSVS